MPDEQEEITPVIVESNPTVIVETPEPVPDPEYSENTLRDFDAWCAECELQLNGLAAELVEIRNLLATHSHEGYANAEHEHGYAASEHEHTEYAGKEHEHASTTRTGEDTPPEPTHPWFRKVG